MKTLTAIFTATKYWPDLAEINETYEILKRSFQSDAVVGITNGDFSEAEKYFDYDAVIIVPISGSVQPDIVKLCEHFDKITIFTSYVSGNFSQEMTDKILYRNAAPTCMDTYAVLKRNTSKTVALKKTFDDLNRYLKVLEASEKVHHGKIVMVKGPEPWVISVSRNFEDYKKQLGIEVQLITQEEIIHEYERTTFMEASKIYEYFKNGASEIVEPTDETIRKCARMACALVKTIQKYQADGMALACFDLITRSGVNPCLGVSYVNGETPWFITCEGDIDSAVTMLMVRALTDEKPWMANPNLQKDDTINFAHCTAPINLGGKMNKFILRSHHETGIGCSPEVIYDTGKTMSLFRYSGAMHKLSINRGVSVPGRYEPTCRTQVRIKLQDMNHYLDTDIGCHQVMIFTDTTKEMTELCDLIKIPVI